MQRELTAKETEFLAKLGEVILDWNMLEASIELIAYKIAGGGHHIDILTAHMGNIRLNDAMRTLANEFGPTELKDEIIFLAELFDRLREFRNYYVHGVRMLGRDDSGTVLALSQSTSAKSRLKLHQDTIRLEDLVLFESNLASAKKFSDKIIGELWGVATLLDAGQPSQPLERPPLPDKLKKPFLFLLDVSQLPQSSHET